MQHTFKGLDSNQVEELRKKFGSNELDLQKKESFWEKLIENFKDPMIIILCVAFSVIIVMSLFHLAEWYEGLGIAVAVILSTFISTFSEYKNESSFQKLQEEASVIKNNVFRDGHVTSIYVNEIVKGDYVLLQSGDKVPADGFVIDGEAKVNQASLTGESEPFQKSKILDNNFAEGIEDFSHNSYLFRDSVIEHGEMVMLVDRVGKTTSYGKLSVELSINDGRQSPLQVKLSDLSGAISKFGYFGATFIGITYLFKSVVINNGFSIDRITAYFSNFTAFFNDALTALILSIVIIVAAVPEGLPMMIAIVLSLNMRKLLNAKVLVRKLLGIESSGSLNILYSDKTGTITKGKLETEIFLTGDNQNFQKYKEVPVKLAEIFSLAVKENTACVVDAEGGIFGGNSSEKAILSFLDKETRIKKIESTLIKKIEFNSAKKFSAVEIKNQTGNLTLLKGASEILLNTCTHFYDKDGNKVKFDNFDKISESINAMAQRGMRTLSVATSETSLNEEEDLPTQNTLICILGIRDEIRKESKHSIEEAQKAGIQVVMITGDKKETAISIAKEVSLIKDESDIVLTSSELNNLSDEELKPLIPKIRVIARALPTDKSRLVRVSQDIGLVVGMTGDGVNDSPALKKADVGFAMGSGSEVAKEAGDIVILDDNFASIIKSILYGRTIFKSIRKFIIFQLTINIGCVFISFLAPLLNIDMPLTIVQILWINVIMDTLAALAFGGEPALERYMLEKPIKRTESIVSRYMWSEILISGTFVTILSLIFLKSSTAQAFFSRNYTDTNKEVFLTAFFCFFVFISVANAFNVRTESINLFEKINENKSFLQVMGFIIFMQVVLTFVGGKILRMVPLNLNEWGYIIILSLSIIPLDILRKMIFKKLKIK